MGIEAFFILVLSLLVSDIDGHGRLIEPPSRASAWRYGFNTPHNYNDHELFCGGFTRQWVKNEGKCGICGDPWDAKTPRAHDYGGTYGQGVVVRKYAVSSVVTVRVELTASHYGYFEFSVCPNYKNPTQQCLDGNLLRLTKPQENVDHLGVRYFPKDGSKVYEMKYRLPNQTCEHCLMQWRYIAGNNWGNCPNGTGAVGCGPQEEFRACADIAILGKSDRPLVTPELEEPDDAPSTTTSSPTPQESYSPISTLLVGLFSFLAVFSILFLIYCHFYQVGSRVKRWFEGPAGKEKAAGPPQPPPRVKRTRSLSGQEPHHEGDGMHEVDLRADSMA